MSDPLCVLVPFDESFFHEYGENVGSRLTVVLALDGLIPVEQRGIVGEEVLHERVIDAGDGRLSLRVGIAVDEVADEVAETVVGNTCAYRF